LTLDIETVKRTRVPPGEGGEADDAPDDHEEDAECGPVQARFFVEYSDPAQQKRDENGGGQQPASHYATRGIAGDDGEETVVLARQEDSRREEQETQRGMEGHRS